MGNDTPLAVLSDKPKHLYQYFKQIFAQVTNPALDCIREELVTATETFIGSEGNLLDPGPHSCRMIRLDQPLLDNRQLAQLREIKLEGFESTTLHALFPADQGGKGLQAAFAKLCKLADDAIAAGCNILIISDRNINAANAAMPTLLVMGGLHHHLVRSGTRTRVSIVLETGEAREVHHFSTLIGYGADAINPYMAFDSIHRMIKDRMLEMDFDKAVYNFLKGSIKGVVKTMAKMGISTVASYRGAQVFEAIGLSQAVIDTYFTGTVSQLGGVGLDVIAQETATRHARAYPPDGVHQPHRVLEDGGEYQWRRDGEPHLFDPETVFRLQHSTRQRRYDVFKQYTSRIDDQTSRLMTLRGLMDFKSPGVTGRLPVPLDEVEPVSEIVKRFNTGAMSYGSISQEAHETLAIAMNHLGGRSNTGEGGEDKERLLDPERRSAVKQVASGRFGVTSLYLTHSDDIQIKMAQGAKPGEGGQLPGHKVYPWVAKTRHSTPGVGLISPPPHHDIYSIEDLAQLIHDLKNANPAARIHVKLVSEIGVGTVAAGVSKAHADVVLISGHDGGTGASPLTSLKHAGAPWELGLAEAQQTLVLNGLRDRIVVQVDGQLKTGRDVVVAALLGAEEFGFATAPLVVSGCIMMRVCHLDTCPVGIATQNPELRARFSGRPEFVETFFEYIAEEVREHLAALGFRSIEEAVGQVDSLDLDKAITHWKASGLDLTPILTVADNPSGGTLFQSTVQDHALDKALDNELLSRCLPAIESGEQVRSQIAVRNVNRTVGTMLGHHVTKSHPDGLGDNTIELTMTGSGGQSFGAFLPAGVTIRLFGDANDYVGKGLSGGRIVVRPSEDAAFVAEENVIAGNVIGYGATAGEIFLRGTAGERFCVRNSGASAVVEGVGDHGCEYMTGGTAVVLGHTGRNFAAGMSGGLAYVLDLRPELVNQELVDLMPLRAEDETLLRDLLARHLTWTESAVARRLLDEWEHARSRFTLVLPRDYQRVLDVRTEAAEQGLDVDGAEVWNRIMEASRG
jgi:glutamate synthase (NADPH/NADH) large chain